MSPPNSVTVFSRIAAVLLLSLLTACASFYVDNQLRELRPEDRVAVTHPAPVQLLFEFQTKGTVNAQATALVKDTVRDSVEKSGLFSQIVDGPTPNGAILHVVINNVPLTDDAFAKGFATGFTFGLVGSNVADGYICTVEYVSGPNVSTISKTERDAIYTALGATASIPPHADKVSSIDLAVKIMAHKVVANALNDVAKDPAFPK